MAATPIAKLSTAFFRAPIPDLSLRIARKGASAELFFVLVSMVGHPIRYRLRLIGLRVPRHENEKREVDDGEDARGIRVARCRRHQAKITERNEAHRERE